MDPRIRWLECGIELDDNNGDVVELDGRGLLLMPSAYTWPLVIAICDKPWQPTVVYPARGIEALWQQSLPPPAVALAQLLGHTRARLLNRLDTPTSTTALAAQTELSPSGVSGHLVTLRNAGLVTAYRHGHEMRYARTPLGSALVRRASVQSS